MFTSALNLFISQILTGLHSSMRSSCSGMHLSSTGSRISNGTPPVSWSTVKRSLHLNTNPTNWQDAEPCREASLAFTHCQYCSGGCGYTVGTSSAWLGGRRSWLPSTLASSCWAADQWTMGTPRIRHRNPTLSRLWDKKTKCEEQNEKVWEWRCSCAADYTFHVNVINTGWLFAFRQRSR